MNERDKMIFLPNVTVKVSNSTGVLQNCMMFCIVILQRKNKINYLI